MRTIEIVQTRDFIFWLILKREGSIYMMFPLNFEKLPQDISDWITDAQVRELKDTPTSS